MDKNSHIAHPVQNQEGRVYQLSCKLAKAAGTNLATPDPPIHAETMYFAVS